MLIHEILPRIKIYFGTSCGGKLSEFLEKILDEVVL
jgi:hypothetical protein